MTMMKCKPGQRVEGEEMTVRPLLLPAEVQAAIDSGTPLFYVLIDGHHWIYFPVTVNGALKTWERSPERWELPVVYGKADRFTVTGDVNKKSSISAVARYLAIKQ